MASDVWILPSDAQLSQLGDILRPHLTAGDTFEIYRGASAIGFRLTCQNRAGIIAVLNDAKVPFHAERPSLPLESLDLSPPLQALAESLFEAGADFTELHDTNQPLTFDGARRDGPATRGDPPKVGETAPACQKFEWAKVGGWGEGSDWERTVFDKSVSLDTYKKSKDRAIADAIEKALAALETLPAFTCEAPCQQFVAIVLGDPPMPGTDAASFGIPVTVGAGGTITVASTGAGGGLSTSVTGGLGDLIKTVVTRVQWNIIRGCVGPSKAAPATSAPTAPAAGSGSSPAAPTDGGKGYAVGPAIAKMDCPQIGDTGEESDTQDSQLETGKAYVQVEKEITAKARKQALEKAKEAAKKSLAALGPCPATCPNVTMTVSFGPRTEISSLYTSKPNFFGSTSPRCKAVATCGWSVKRICS